MAGDRQRISIDPALWEAVVAVAKAQKVHPSTVVERALYCYLNPTNTIEKAVQLTRQFADYQAKILDAINVIEDVINAQFNPEYDGE